MNESEYNGFDPESQFMLTCPGNRLPVSTGSPPGDCLRGHPENAPSDSLERSVKDNDLTYKLAPTKRMPRQDSTASSGDLEPPPVLKLPKSDHGHPKARHFTGNLLAEESVDEHASSGQMLISRY